MLKAIVTLLVAVFVVAIAGAGWMAWFSDQPLALRASPLEVTVQPGSSARSAARQIAAAGVRMQPWQFELLARALGQDADLKAGTYVLETGITARGLLDKLVRGDVAMTEVVFVEGWTFRQMREALDAHAHVKHETAGASAADIMARLGAAGVAPEGRFFPDTYRFARGTSDLEVLRMAFRAMQRRLEAAWEARADGLPLASPDEALILASIVEKETGRAEDRAVIAAVFVNRLRAGIRLQSDPTVIYGMGERFDGNLRRRDLESDGPYNTYTRAGLPPTPIAMPGLASLQATLNPAASDALYFVARGDGSSEFSRTLQEHNRAVTKYQRGGR
ncbi:MAG: endolytic transglycosylase MltG [Burkholderiales bacterium]|nr:endolytic transglycosylase MltG [Burkholderiales bacterium]